MIYKLKKGDKVKVIAPSSYIDNEREFLNGIAIMKNWGLNVINNYLAERKCGYFAGNDNFRFDELEKAQNSKLIICAKGGWGASRLLEKNLKWQKNWFLGFSDNCSLLLAKHSINNIGSIHGPTISSLSTEPNWSLERLRNFLFEGYLDDIKGKPIKDGCAHGKMIVSNLTIFCSLIGTNKLPKCDGAILIFEDINEDIYKIDRMFTSLRMAHVLDNIAGIGFGNFFDKKDFEKQSLFEKLIFDRFGDFNIPIVSNLPIGHISGNACIPFGFKGKLNGKNGNLSINTSLLINS